jgi:hypothetical protein
MRNLLIPFLVLAIFVCIPKSALWENSVNSMYMSGDAPSQVQKGTRVTGGSQYDFALGSPFGQFPMIGTNLAGIPIIVKSSKGIAMHFSKVRAASAVGV